MSVQEAGGGLESLAAEQATPLDIVARESKKVNQGHKLEEKAAEGEGGRRRHTIPRAAGSLYVLVGKQASVCVVVLCMKRQACR